MKKHAKITSVLFIMFLILLWAVLANAEEPAPPVVDSPLDPATDAEIDQLASLPSDQAFKKLEEKELFSDDKVLYKAIFKAFKSRKKEALDVAAKDLALPLHEQRDGKTIDRWYDFSVAKKIFEVFYDEGASLLNQLYGSGDPITRENVVNASGNVTGVKVRKLLIDALEDKTFSEQTAPEKMGKPMRICDAAYNQLVLRYKIGGVLRTIGPVYDTEDRDYHISIVYNLLENGRD